MAPISVRDASRGRHDSQKHLQTHAFVDAGIMPKGKKRGSRLPPGMLSAQTKKEIDKKIENQCKALLAKQSEPTKLLPREHPNFFASIDPTNVDDESLLSISLEDLPSDRVFQKDGGRGTNRKAVQLYLKDRLARAAQPDEADAKEVERAEKRARGELPYEFAGLGDEARKAAWRKLLVIAGSSDLAVGKNEFVKRTGGIGAHFWTALKAERAAAMADEARGRGEVKTSIRERTYTVS